MLDGHIYKNPANHTKTPKCTKKKSPQNCNNQICFLFIPSYTSQVQTGAVHWEAVIACQEDWSSSGDTFPVKPLLSNLKISACQTGIHRLEGSAVVAVSAVAVSSAVFLCKLLGGCRDESSWCVCNAVRSVAAVPCAYWARLMPGRGCFL